jgi:hypothetical protein
VQALFSPDAINRHCSATKIAHLPAINKRHKEKWPGCSQKAPGLDPRNGCRGYSDQRTDKYTDLCSVSTFPTKIP